MNFSNFKLDSNTAWQICILFCLTAAIFFIPESAAASTDTDPLGDIICKIVAVLTGKLGKGISMIAVIVLGIGIFLGKLSWALAIATAIGIGLIFSSAKIVAWLSGSDAQCS